MRLTRLRSSCPDTDSCPALYTTDRGTVVVQGYVVSDIRELGASDGSDYRRYLDGADAPTFERKQPWLDTLRAWAEEGRPRRRVRIIHDPITDYERYACEWGYALNAQAGEIIRVIDLAQTQLPPELVRIAGDFWLIDGHEVVAMHYQPDGQFRAAEILDPQHVPEYSSAAQVAWALGLDFTTWWTDHPHHRRSAHRVA